jgi:hypothetical protein
VPSSADVGSQSEFYLQPNTQYFRVIHKVTYLLKHEDKEDIAPLATVKIMFLPIDDYNILFSAVCKGS